MEEQQFEKGAEEVEEISPDIEMGREDDTDTSFSRYMEAEKEKEKEQTRSFYAGIKRGIRKILKWTVGFPFYLFVLATAVVFLGTVLMGSITAFGTTFFVLAATTFAGVVQTALVGWLGFFIALGLIAIGGLLMVLFVWGVKQVRRLILTRKYRGGNRA